jgi:hypothetical protein
VECLCRRSCATGPVLFAGPNPYPSRFKKTSLHAIACQPSRGRGTATRSRALALGAKDFLTKPFDAIEVDLRIFNLLETRVLMLELAKHGIDPPKSNRLLME